MSYRLIEQFTTRQTFAARSFSVAAPRLWNNLPNSLKDSSSIEQFKKGLKTHLFCNAFNNLKTKLPMSTGCYILLLY